MNKKDTSTKLDKSWVITKGIKLGLIVADPTFISSLYFIMSLHNDIKNKRYTKRVTKKSLSNTISDAVLEVF